MVAFVNFFNKRQKKNAGLKCAARGSLNIQDAKNSASARHRTTLWGYIFTTKASVDNGEKTW